MDEAKTAKTLTPEQQSFVTFLAAGKVDENGKKWTEGDFAKKRLKIHYTTVSRWKLLPAVREAVMEEALGKAIDFVPAMLQAQIRKAIKKEDTQAFLAVMRQAGLLRPDRKDITSDGKALPTPILGGVSLDEE
jgi:hypothetical protein